MLALLLNTPQTPDDWSRWSFHHRTSHSVIRQAIQTQRSINLQDYLIDPIPLDQTMFFLEANQQYHTDMNGVLGNQGSDLEDVNIQDQKQLQAWIYLHYLEHQTAEQKLGVAS